VEVNPKERPPVCRIVDYGKFKYEQKKRDAKKRKAQKRVELKEIKFRPTVDEHDFQTKAKKVLDFLENGHRVKVTVQFRGREIIHPDLGVDICARVADLVDGLAEVTQAPRLEGRNLTMTLAVQGKKAAQEQAPISR
jgi:translation initiation factor IF-3